MKKLVILCTVILVVLLSIISVVGCQKQPEPTLPPAPAIPAHFTTYTNEAGLFSISYPPDWEPALSLIEGYEQTVKDVITSIAADAPVERASIIFFAGLPIETGYWPNVNIVVESLPGIVWTHDNLVEAEVRGIKELLQDYHEFSRLKTTVGGREATIIESEGTFPGAEKTHYLQLYTLVGKTAWAVTCTTSPGEFNEWEEDLNAVLRSLRILK